MFISWRRRVVWIIAVCSILLVFRYVQSTDVYSEQNREDMGALLQKNMYRSELRRVSLLDCILVIETKRKNSNKCVDPALSVGSVLKIDLSEVDTLRDRGSYVQVEYKSGVSSSLEVAKAALRSSAQGELSDVKDGLERSYTKMQSNIASGILVDAGVISRKESLRCDGGRDLTIPSPLFDTIHISGTEKTLVVEELRRNIRICD